MGQTYYLLLINIKKKRENNSDLLFQNFSRLFSKWLKYFFWPFSDLSVNHLKRAAKATVCLSLFSDFLSKKQKQHLKTSKKTENSQVKIHNNQKTPLNYHSGSFLNYATLIWLKFNTPASSIMPKLQLFCYLYDIILQILCPLVALCIIFLFKI